MESAIVQREENRTRGVSHSLSPPSEMRKATTPHTLGRCREAAEEQYVYLESVGGAGGGNGSGTRFFTGGIVFRYAKMALRSLSVNAEND